ncbi:hypothetical protein NE237_020888 [Protea cynaroides]|uniref:Uncharacterized protein n=1 Tax=Protea cynaroides TaxID=273540 RepID=A0A9Q0K4C3_9MAGN|nr:hypothetical protein NE237_020888 [Protea cynaroides]
MGIRREEGNEKQKLQAIDAAIDAVITSMDKYNLERKEGDLLVTGISFFFLLLFLFLLAPAPIEIHSLLHLSLGSLSLSGRDTWPISSLFSPCRFSLYLSSFSLSLHMNEIPFTSGCRPPLSSSFTLLSVLSLSLFSPRDSSCLPSSLSPKMRSPSPLGFRLTKYLNYLGASLLNLMT